MELLSAGHKDAVTGREEGVWPLSLGRKTHAKGSSCKHVVLLPGNARAILLTWHEQELQCDCFWNSVASSVKRAHLRGKNNRGFSSSVPKGKETGCDSASMTINIPSSFNNSGFWPVRMKSSHCNHTVANRNSYFLLGPFLTWHCSPFSFSSSSLLKNVRFPRTAHGTQWQDHTYKTTCLCTCLHWGWIQ